jgi:molybdenum ABC transporter molybdate-binding protein
MKHFINDSLQARLWKKMVLGASALFLSVSTVNAGAECTGEPNPNITIAVASNMWIPAQELVKAFNATQPGNYVIQVCHNSTGNLILDINNGIGNYSLFLAANATAPYQVNTSLRYGNVSNYTTGIPVLWSHNANLLTKNSSGDFNGSINLYSIPSGGKVVIANQTKAPYGLAAQEIMEYNTSQWGDVNSSGSYSYLLHIEDNIDATYTYIDTHSDSIGYVARSQICRNSIDANYTYSKYPSTYNIPQAGVVLNNGNTTLAKTFWDWLRDSYAQNILVNRFCYGNITSPSTTVTIGDNDGKTTIF